MHKYHNSVILSLPVLVIGGELEKLQTSCLRNPNYFWVYDFSLQILKKSDMDL